MQLLLMLFGPAAQVGIFGAVAVLFVPAVFALIALQLARLAMGALVLPGRGPLSRARLAVSLALQALLSLGIGLGVLFITIHRTEIIQCARALF